jgi:hypothetical protein
MGDGTASQDLVDFLFKEFEDQKRNAVMLADVLECEDVRMAQRRRPGLSALTGGGAPDWRQKASGGP